MRHPTTMTTTALALLLATASACVPSYLVRPSELARAEVPAVRERDGRAVTLAGGSFRVTEDAPLADGRVRVRGPGRHGRTWLIGLIMTTVGIGIGLTAVGLGVHSTAPASSDGSITPSSDHAMALAAIVLGSFGGLGGAILGPTVWIVGARQPPTELRH